MPEGFKLYNFLPDMIHALSSDAGIIFVILCFKSVTGSHFGYNTSSSNPVAV
jgi:hypothetical protein